MSVRIGPVVADDDVLLLNSAAKVRSPLPSAAPRFPRPTAAKYVRRADILLSDESRRRRGCHVNSPRRRVAAAPSWLARGGRTRKGGSVTGTYGPGSRLRRGRDVDSPRRRVGRRRAARRKDKPRSTWMVHGRVAAPPRLPRGYSAEARDDAGDRQSETPKKNQTRNPSSSMEEHLLETVALRTQFARLSSAESKTCKCARRLGLGTIKIVRVRDVCVCRRSIRGPGVCL